MSGRTWADYCGFNGLSYEGEQVVRQLESRFRPKPKPKPYRYVNVGVDLGQRKDYTAIAVVEREDRAKPGAGREASTEYHYLVRGLERLPLGTKYPRVVDRIVEIMGGLKQKGIDDKVQQQTGLYVDASGLGQPVVDLMEGLGLGPQAVTLTGSDLTTELKPVEGKCDAYTLGKGALVSNLQALIELGRIHLPAATEARVLEEEMKEFQRKQKPDTGHLAFGASTGNHDDYITALGLACWDRGMRGDPADYGDYD